MGVTAGAIAGQALVGKLGFRPVAAAGLPLIAAGCLYLTRVLAGGSYFGDIFLGLLICGPGVGFQAGVAACIVLAGAGLVFALALGRRLRGGPLESVPEPAVG